MAPPPIAQIGAVLDRMSALRGLVSPTNDLPPPIIQSDIEFDAFGDTYQAALKAARPAPEPTVQSWSALGLDGVGGFGGSTAGAAAGPAGNVRPATEWTPDVLAAAVAGTAGAPGARPIGGYGSMPVPPSLAAFGNGQIPSDALTPIRQSGHRLYAPAAAAWDSLVSAAAADGVSIRITDSYRSFDQQVDLVRRKGLYSEGGLGARPGTSNHGWGLAVDADVNDARTLDWMRTNAPRFGFVEAVPREPWHWEFRPQQVS
jgi:hypothetical protein